MKRFLNYVEIQTKITSLFTFIFTILVMNFMKMDIMKVELLVFFCGMFVFDLTTTSINNYIDSKTNGQNIGYSRQKALIILWALLLVSVAFGLWLVYLTDLVVLFVGMISFGVGIFYTYGPIPISRQPYGELISGIMYGYVIPFLMMYVVAAHGYIVHIEWSNWILNLNINILEAIQFIFIFSAPAFLTASIMLANNICDLDADIVEKRYTLVYYLGQDLAKKCMYLLLGSLFLIYPILGVLRVLPLSVIGFVMIMGLVLKNLKDFFVERKKHLSFKFIIKNFMMSMSWLITLMVIGIIFGI